MPRRAPELIAAAHEVVDRDRRLRRRRHRAGAAARRAEDLERKGAAFVGERTLRDRPHRREAERRVVADRAARRVEHRPQRVELHAPDRRHAVCRLVVVGDRRLPSCCAYITTMLLPTLSARWAAIRAIARAALELTGIPVEVTGLERLPSGNAVILFNHTSYMDAVSSPRCCRASRLSSPRRNSPTSPSPALHAPARRCVRGALRRGGESRGCRCGDRHGEAGPPVRVLSRKARSRAAPDLLGFYMGAFKVAAEANLPVVPGSCAACAPLLRGDQWFPRRHADQRRDRGADPAGRHRLYRHAGPARCGPRRDAQARRRAGFGCAGKAAGPGCLTKVSAFSML